MPNDLKFSRLCNLVNDSIHPYTEAEVISLTTGKEKDLLISLSEVWREIQLMKQELDYDSDEEAACESARDKKFSGESELHHEDHNCLSKILADLIFLLTVESLFVHHLVGNILVVISEFLMASASEWESFIHSMFICMELAISNVSSHSLAASTNGARDSNCDSSSFVVLKSRLQNANWSTAATIIRVLRNTSKYLKQEDDNQLHKTFLDSVSSFLLNVPWDFMDQIQVGQSGGTKGSNSGNSHFVRTIFRNVDQKETEVVFLGNFIQFLCSLVEQSCAVETEIGSQHDHPVLCIIISSVPKLFCWCLGEQRNCAEMPISQYFRHKLLMLMLRLSYQTCLGCSTLISWLRLLNNYFEELLWKPIIELEFGQDESIEGSPFLLSLSDGEVNGVNSDHLRRWAILLYLRCCFGLISLTRDSNEQCACGTCKSYLTFDSGSDLICCGRKKGCLELYKWLQGHLPTDVFVDHETNLVKCVGFALSFLQLYMHEDDVLFKVLLQLLSIQSCLDQLSQGGKWTFEDVKEDFAFHFTSIFNPVYLFHLFLAELHYDHQVLLDYLISKDTGISSAEYLLRCLRIVCNSWQLFVTFSMHEKVVNHSSCKKRKMVLHGSNLQVEASSTPIKYIPSAVEEKTKEDFKYSHKHWKNISPLFKKAENCLLSLKGVMENLHRKNLFPYNPEVLLKRLTKFQELCFD
ncbi:uncharacterized protein LOC105639968 isoform X2 [Jatropha curcas]|uniref:uncharacterized protein LOC105639968 isoform X2 n=1 Tax=Jatropha curcas TaxID=180498 RepID=UPI0005FBF9F6|nr:uncharacterized protein LOC105639968 isoform X2 [Jatropha curcas]